MQETDEQFVMTHWLLSIILLCTAALAGCQTASVSPVAQNNSPAVTNANTNTSNSSNSNTTVSSVQELNFPVTFPVIDRWYQIESQPEWPRANYFKVRATDGRDYLLKHDQEADEWFLGRSW